MKIYLLSFKSLFFVEIKIIKKLESRYVDKLIKVKFAGRER